MSMLLEFGVVGEHLGMRVSLDERIMEVIELGVCERWWCRTCDPKSTDARDGGFPFRRVGMFDRTYTKLHRSSMDVVC